MVVKNPKGWQQYGNNVAGPVFKEIADNIYARDIELHAPMEKKTVLEAGVLPVIRGGRQEELTMLANELGVSTHSATEEEWVKASRNGSSVTWKKNEVLKDRVPDVTGLTFRDALYLCEKSGLRVVYQGRGRVAEQSLAPGTRFGRGARIYLKLS